MRNVKVVADIKIIHLGIPAAQLAEIEALLNSHGLDLQLVEVGSEEQFTSALEAIVPDVILASENEQQQGLTRILEILHSGRIRVPLIEIAPNASANYVLNAFRKGVDNLVLDLEDLPKALLNILGTEDEPFLEMDRDFSGRSLSNRGREGKSFSKPAGSVLSGKTIPRKRTDSRSIDRSKDYKTLFQLSPLPHWIYDRDTLEILDVNQTSIDHYGYSRDEFLEMNLKDIRPEEEIEELMNDLENLTGGGRVHFNRSIHSKKDGSKIFVDVYGYAVTFGSYNARQVVIVDVTEKVQAKKELLEINTRYELASKATFDAIYEMTLENGQMICSQSNHSLFGNVNAEGNIWLQHIHPNDRDRVMKAFKLALEGEDEFLNESYRYLTKNGEYATVINRGIILRDDRGKVIRVVGALRDVTEKKRLEELLENANSLSRIGSFEIDLNKETIYWSPIVKEIHEVEPDFQPTFENVVQFLEEKDFKAEVLTILQRSATENKAFDFETKIITAKEKVIWVRFMGQPDCDNENDRIRGSLQDITKIKQAELEVTKTSEDKENILETIGDGFIAVNQDWEVTYWNRQAEILLERSKEKALGNKIWESFPDQTGTGFYRKLQMNLINGEKARLEVFYKKSNEWYEISAYPGKNGSSIYFKNISERKQSECEMQKLNQNLQEYTQELTTAYKGLEQFSFIVSHNLRSPVANIMGLADIIQMKDTPEEVVRQMQEEIINNVRRLDDVITDLNGILRIKKDTSEQKEIVVLDDLVNTIKQSLGNLREEQVEIYTDLTAVPKLLTIKSYIHSIFYNLISNSIKYRQPFLPAVIHITTAKKNGMLCFSFEDNGLGIDLARKKDELFGLYRRFHSHVPGKGMGLFMVKTQVEMLGGRISIASELNKGTTFSIEFKDEKL